MRRRIDNPARARLIDPYRVLVKAHPDSRARAFIWQIVRSTTEGLSIKVESTVTYKTMHEAFTAGAAALSKLSQP